MDSNSLQTQQQIQEFRIKHHQRHDFANYMSEYHGWTLRGSKTHDPFELFPPANVRLSEERVCLTEETLIEFFKERSQEYNDVITGFVDRKKGKLRLLDWTAQASDASVASEALVGLNQTPKRKSVCVASSSKRQRVICSWPKCEYVSTGTCKKSKEPRCEKHQSKEPCEVEGCYTAARGGNDFPGRCEKHGGGWRCEHPQCNKIGKIHGSGKRLCGDHGRQWWRGVRGKEVAPEKEFVANQGETTANDLLSHTSDASEALVDPHNTSKQRSVSTTRPGTSASVERVESSLCSWTKCPNIATCVSRLQQPRCAKHRHFRVCEIIGCPSKARGGDVCPNRCRRHRKVKCDLPDCNDPATHAFGDIVRCADHKEHVESNNVNSDPLANSRREEDPLSKVAEAREKLMKELRVYSARQKTVETLQLQTKALQQDHDKYLQKKRDLKSEVEQAKELYHVEYSRCNRLELKHEDAKKEFSRVLEESDIGNLRSTKENVLNLWKRYTEVQANVYELEASLREKMHAVSEMRNGYKKLETHQEELRKAEEELKIKADEVSKARKEENQVVDRFLLG